MKKLMTLITFFAFFFVIIFPKNFGKHTDLWEFEKRCYDKEYYKERSNYFISTKYDKKWSELSDILYIFVNHDSLSIADTVLWTTLSHECVIKSNGEIYWTKPYSEHIDYYSTTVIPDEPIIVSIDKKKYFLDSCADELKEEFNINAQGKTDTINEMRNDYNRVLGILVDGERKEVYHRMYKSIINVALMWGVWGLYKGLYKGCAILMKKHKEDMYRYMYDENEDMDE